MFAGRPGAFRHLHASELVDRGIEIEVVSKRLGHAKVAITQDLYVTRRDEAERAAGDVAGGMLDDVLRAGCDRVAGLQAGSGSATGSIPNYLKEKGK